MQNKSNNNRIPSKAENPNGLHQRYFVAKWIQGIDMTGKSLEDCLLPVDDLAEYFVLRLDTGGSDIEHIKACRIGVNAYADAIEHHLPELAKDLRERYPLLPIPNEPTTEHVSEDKEKYNANFLWGFGDDSIEALGYEFANAKTENYQKACWGDLIQKIKESTSEDEELFVWVKASEGNLPLGEHKKIIPILYKSVPNIIIYLDDDWYWLDENGGKKYPVHKESWSTIEWLKPTTKAERNISDQNKIEKISDSEIEKMAEQFFKENYGGELSVFSSWIAGAKAIMEILNNKK